MLKCKPDTTYITTDLKRFCFRWVWYIPCFSERVCPYSDVLLLWFDYTRNEISKIFVVETICYCFTISE